jgi:HK97 family phage prohead protease
MKNVTFVCEARVSLKANVSEADQEPSGKIEATVTTWGAREGADGRRFNYQPEGFADWVKEYEANGRPLPMFLNHNDNGMPVGEWNSFEITEDGMSADGRLYLNTVGGSDLYQVLKESPSMFGGVSVGAYADEYQWVKEDGTPMTVGSDDPYEDGYFQITKGGLREVSVVMYPNNPNAEISKLEAFGADGKINPRVLERILRDAGLAKKDATAASSIFKKVLEQRDAPKKSEESPTRSESDAAGNAEEIYAALEQHMLLKALEKRLK